MTLLEWLRQPWPWYVAGPIIGLLVPLLLWLGNYQFGVSGNLRHLCAALLPTRRVDYFRYDWKGAGAWNLLFAAGIAVGGFVGGRLLARPDIALSEGLRRQLGALGITDLHGLVPSQIFSWTQLLSLPSLLTVVAGGLLVGFGTAWAGGCTSGHGVYGLAALEKASLIAVAAFFAGGLLTTWVVLPLLFHP